MIQNETAHTTHALVFLSLESRNDELDRNSGIIQHLGYKPKKRFLRFLPFAFVKSIDNEYRRERGVGRCLKGMIISF
jgi:hypothetical protein